MCVYFLWGVLVFVCMRNVDLVYVSVCVLIVDCWCMCVCGVCCAFGVLVCVCG